jgi:predicted transcriptional regulator of viral defense system
MKGASFNLGREEHIFEGISVKVYSLEKTIIDCFRLRRLVGHEVSVEALRESIHTQKIDVSKLLQLAGQLRSRRLIQPYLEAML